MDTLLKQIDFDIKAIEYLSVITTNVTPHNIEVVRTYFNNDADALLDAILSIDECRKSNKNAIILQTKIKRFNSKRRKSA